MNAASIDVREVRKAALAGRLSVEQLLAIIDEQQQSIQRLKREARRLTERLAQYEPEVRHGSSAGDSARESRSTDYSLEGERNGGGDIKTYVKNRVVSRRRLFPD